MYTTGLYASEIEISFSSSRLFPSLMNSGCSSTSKVNTSSAAWKIVKGLEAVQVKNGYQYLSEKYSNYKMALERQAFYRKNGFPDAGIIAFRAN